MNSWEEFTEKYKKELETIPMYYATDEKELEELKKQLGVKNNEEFKNMSVRESFLIKPPQHPNTCT